MLSDDRSRRETDRDRAPCAGGRRHRIRDGHAVGADIRDGRRAARKAGACFPGEGDAILVPLVGERSGAFDEERDAEAVSRIHHRGKTQGLDDRSDGHDHGQDDRAKRHGSGRVGDEDGVAPGVGPARGLHDKGGVGGARQIHPGFFPLVGKRGAAGDGRSERRFLALVDGLVDGERRNPRRRHALGRSARQAGEQHRAQEKSEADHRGSEGESGAIRPTDGGRDRKTGECRLNRPRPAG